MKLSAPVLTGLVIGLIAFTMANNGSADEPDRAAATTPSQDDDGTADDDDDDDAESGPSDEDGTSDDEPDDGFPDTGGASIPKLPAAAGGGGVVTLTFDDGPHTTYTPQVLDMLAAHEVAAVFCVVGEKVREHPELVRRIVDEGHALCNHTDSHDPELAQRSPEAIGEEIDDTARAIAGAAPGAQAPFFRQPAMYVTPEVAPIAHERGLTVLDWTVDTRDWSRPGASAIVQSVVDDVQPGSVVLLHDGGGDRTQTVQALAQILTMLKAAGYQTVIPEAG